MSRRRAVVLAVFTAGLPAPGLAAPPAAAPGAAASAAAPPVASQRFDLDRDGAPEEVRIERDGSLAVTGGRSGAVVAWKPLTGAAGAAVDRGEIQIATGSEVGGRVVIVAVGIAAGAGGRGEALAAEWRGGLHELWRGSVGPQGVDGESTLYIEAGRHGLIRYSGRAGVARCDGKTAHLYAEKFDFGPRGGRFRPVDDVPRIAADAPRLTATRTPPAGAAAASAPMDFRVLAASSQAGAGPGDLVAPTELDDRDPSTAWVEGRGGFGRGEFVTARASLDGGAVRAIRIVPGHAASGRTFAQFNRLKRVGLLVGRDRAYWAVFPRDPLRAGAPADAYWIALPEPVQTDCVSLVVAEVYPGQGVAGATHAGGGQTAIAELSVLTEMDLAPGGAAGLLAAKVAAGGRDGEQAVRVLERIGRAAGPALVAEAAKAGTAATGETARLRLRRALAALPAGEAEIAAGLAVRDLHPADAERFSRALVAIGGPSVAPVAGVLGDEDRADEGRIRAAQVLARIPEASALEALAAAAGRGSRELRRAVSLALGQRGELDEIVGLAVGAAAGGGLEGREGREGREADLWRAVGLVARQQPSGEARGRVIRAIRDRLASAQGYELRYRLLEAAGGLDDPGLVAVLGAYLAAAPGAAAVRGDLATAQGAALRRVAAAALGRSHLPAAVSALARGAADPDPGVREAVAEALGERGGAGGDGALAGQLGRDRWPRVRRAAAVALGSACQRPGPATSLRRAALGDADVQVRRAALSSLVSCGAAGTVEFLLAVAADRRAPGELRTHALRLIGGSGDRSAARPLAALVTAELERAFSDETALAPAAAGVYALGQLGGPDALPVVMRAAETVAFPEIQAAAANALGHLCPADGLAVLRDLAQSSQHQVSSPARAALRRCRPRR